MTTPAQLPLPLFDVTGFASVYLSLPAGAFLEEWREAKRRLRDVPGAVESDPELLHILGQASLAARLHLRDFRGLIRHVYPGASSRAIVANTVFSTPYVITRKTAPAGSREFGVFRFMTHIRVRRSAYRYDPVAAESFIVEKLRDMTELDGADVTIDAGIGWADFVLSGTLQVEHFPRFLEWLVEFNRLPMGSVAGTDGYAFKRTLTLIGYPWTNETGHNVPFISGFKAPARAVIFLRAKRGRLAEVRKALQNKFNSVDVAFVDGKYDILAICEPTLAFFKQHQEFVLSAGENWIERLETHLMFQAADTESERASPVPDCHCTHLAEKISRFVESSKLDVLPAGTATAIKNVAFLSAATAQDSSSCCDARPAIVAVWRTLRRLIIRIERQREETRAVSLPEEPRVRLDRNIKKNLERIDLWLLTADRVLRQRTVGSFEEFLGQSDRSLSYGGGVQKGLLVCDLLMNDFYSKMTGKRSRYLFASVYDSVDHIRSVVRTGIVRIPVTKAFNIPGALPDLWHEVGCYEFFRVFPMSRFTRPITAARYRALADHFGDLVSLVYGFDLDFHRFATALVHGWYESKAHSVPWDSPPSRESDEARELSYSVLLNRLVVALEFYVAIETPSLLVNRERLLAWAFVMTERLAGNYLGKRAPKRHFRRGPRTLNALLHADADLKTLRNIFAKKDIEQAKRRRSAWSPRLALDNSPSPLIRFDETTDLNTRFRDLYLAIEDTRDKTSLKAASAFAPLAALSRSAAIEYYRRMASTTT